MGFFKNIADGFKVNQRADDDEYFLDEGYYDDEDYEDEQPSLRNGGIFGKRQSAADNQPETRSGGFFGRGKVTQVTNAPMQVAMKKPKNTGDAKDICNELLAGKAVVVNLEGVNSDLAQRISDFTYGATYSLDGDIQKISKYIFIASPYNVTLSGDFDNSFGMSSASDGQQSPYGESRSRASGFSFNS